MSRAAARLFVQPVGFCAGAIYCAKPGQFFVFVKQPHGELPDNPSTARLLDEEAARDWLDSHHAPVGAYDKAEFELEEG